jgi:protein-S-isoprenylcysteine O-methyltransferase Ste14
MSLGFYLWVLGVALITGSTAFTIGVLFAIIPAHLLCLLYFEEFELRLRLGAEYEAYRRSTPFLIPARRRA